HLLLLHSFSTKLSNFILSINAQNHAPSQYLHFSRPFFPSYSFHRITHLTSHRPFRFSEGPVTQHVSSRFLYHDSHVTRNRRACQHYRKDAHEGQAGDYQSYPSVSPSLTPNIPLH